MTAQIRTFETGASRDTDEDKLDYEGFLSPAVLERFAEYMHANRRMADGSRRDADNWQKGMPRSAYVKSLARHFMDVWGLHRCDALGDRDAEDALCGVMFNAMGLLYEILEGRDVERDARDAVVPPADDSLGCMGDPSDRNTYDYHPWFDDTPDWVLNEPVSLGGARAYPAFKVGDRVKGVISGRYGIVTEVDAEQVWVLYDGSEHAGTEGSAAFYQPAPPTEYEPNDIYADERINLKVGDRVRTRAAKHFPPGTVRDINERGVHVLWDGKPATPSARWKPDDLERVR